MIVFFIIYLCLLFQIKHFVCDFPLQNAYMLGKFKEQGWVLPLAAHASVHALGTLLCLYLGLLMLGLGTFDFFLSTIPLAMFDFGAHFAMDRIKASPNLLGRFKALSGKEYMSAKGIATAQVKLYGRSEQYYPDHEVSKALEAIKGNTYFWWALGLDQFVHHVTHYLIILMFLIGVIL